MNGEMGQVRSVLVENLKELHLPAMRGCFEETARRAEKETLSYERYLLELAQRECEERRRKRIGKLLKESGLPLEKSLAREKALDRISAADVSVADIICLLPTAFRMTCNTCSR
jgi:hypothetical protein